MALPGDAIVKILTAMVKQCPFDSAGEAGRSLLNCGLVSKSWHEAATHKAVWRALYLRCSPGHVRARDGAMPVPRDSDDDANENKYYDSPDFFQDGSSILARSRYFADSIVSPFVLPKVPNVLSFHDLFRSRYLAARHAATAYRGSRDTVAASQLYTSEGPQERTVPKFTCATVLADDELRPDEDLREISFVFELFGADSPDRNGHLVTDTLRNEYAGPPHFAARDDLGDKTENLLWAATVRANEDGLVQALVPLDDQGRLKITHTVPVDLGDTINSINRWCESWRLVVTAVRDDGKICQIIDIRDKSDIGFRTEGDDGPAGGSCYFRVAELGDDSESLECKVHFGVNTWGGPVSQGFTHRHAWKCEHACAGECATRRRDRGEERLDDRGVYWVHQEEEFCETRLRVNEFWDGAVEPGEMFQISISWLYFDAGETEFPDGTELDGTLCERSTAFTGWTTARRLNNPGHSHVPDNEEFVDHVRMVESKLARLNWL